MVFERIGIGLLMMLLSTFIHALFMIGGTLVFEWRLNRFGPAKGHFAKAVLVWVLTTRLASGRH